MANMDRRTFVQLGLGMLATLPAVAEGAFLMPLAPHAALADEEEPKAHIVVVRRSEVGFVVMDMASDKRVPVAGAHVLVTSRFNQQTAEGTTDDEGKLVLDLQGLSEQTDDGTYACNASIHIACDGYRTWRAELTRLEGGVAYSVPTHALEQGVPYPALVGFNGWDVLYTQSEFCASPKNDATHTLRVELENGGDGAAIRLTSRDGKTTYASGTAKAAGAAAVWEASGAWLTLGSAGALPPGGSFSLAYDVGTTTYTVDINLGVTQNMKGADDVAEQSYQSFSPFDASPGATEISIPKNVPLLGGGTITPALPTFPVNIAVDPFGFLRISWGPIAGGYAYDNGDKANSGWKTFPSQSIKDQFDKMVKEVDDMSTKVSDSLSKPGAVTQMELSAMLQAKVMAQLVAAARWDRDADTLDGYLSAQAALYFLLSVAENFWAGPLPILLEFELNLRVVFSVFGVAFHKQGISDIPDWDSYSFDYSNTGTTLTIVISPSISVGLGVRGVASISVRGAVTFTTLLGIAIKHVMLGLNLKASVVVQMFLFSAEFTIAELDMPKFYDYWPDGALSNEGLVFEPNSFDMSNLRFIGSANLQRLAEYTDNRDAGENDAAAGFAPMEDEAEKVALVEGGEQPAFGRTETHPFVNPHTREGMPQGPAALVHDLTVVTERYSAFSDKSNGEYANDEDPATGAGGVVPCMDTQLVQNVLSDPRVESHVIGGVLYTFRLASVLVKGQPRTRVVAEATIDGKDEYHVIDVETAFHGPYASRANLLDYDFAVSVPKDGNGFALCILSSTMPADDATIYNMVCNCDIYNVFICYGGPEHVSLAYSSSFMNSYGDKTGMYRYSLSNPWVDYQNSGKWLAGAMVRRCDTGSEQDIFDNATLNYALFYKADLRKGAQDEPETGAWTDSLDVALLLPHGTLDPSQGEWDPWMGAGDTHEADVIPANEAHTRFTLMWRGSNEKDTGRTGSHYGVFSYAGGAPSELQRCSDYDERVRLVAWPGHNAMLCAHNVGDSANPDWHLQAATWSDTTLAFEDVGPDDFATSDFGVDASGSYLFYASSRDGQPGYTYDDPTNPQPAPDVHEHRIMACRWRSRPANNSLGGSFCDPFVFGQVEHPLDQLHVAGEVGSAMQAWNGIPAMCFVSTQITDAQAGSADLWLTAMPEVSCATVLDVQSDMPLLSRAAPAEFYVTLRNDGNTFLSGCTLGIALAGADVPGDAQWTRLDFSKESLRESAYNPKGDDGELQDVEYDYALAPGKTAVYSVMLTLAEDWEGELDVTVRSKDATVVPTMTPAADGVAEPHQLDGGRGLTWEPKDAIVIPSASATDGSGLADAPIRTPDKKDGGSAPAAGALGGSGRAPLANTADGWDVRLPGVLAAAGAGLVAYSRRRTRLEG